MARYLAILFSALAFSLSISVTLTVVAYPQDPAPAVGTVHTSIDGRSSNTHYTPRKAHNADHRLRQIHNADYRPRQIHNADYKPRQIHNALYEAESLESPPVLSEDSKLSSSLRGPRDGGDNLPGELFYAV